MATTRKGPARTEKPRRGARRLWRQRGGWAWGKLKAAPRSLQIGIAVAAFVVIFAAANLAYHVVAKPTELFFPIGNALNKTPGDTWERYGAYFQQYSTAAAPPELLAALAQIEGAGNPVARTYWRWRFSWHPFAIYEPASSAVGMYQMTDPAFVEAKRYCVRQHSVEDNCGLTGLYTRVVPSHAIELAAVYLDRNVARILGDKADAATPQQKQDLAAIIHLCGAGPARRFAQHGFHFPPGERCGDHDAAEYLTKFHAAERQFRRLAGG